MAATVNSPDASRLELMTFERQVSQLKGSSGAVIKNPTTDQQNASTLDHLCAANNHLLPGTSSFSWNWVLPTEVDQYGGGDVKIHTYPETSPTKDQTASSMSFATHFKNNFGSLVVMETKVTTDVVQEAIDGLLGAISTEGEVLSEVYTKLQEVATNASSMSVADTLKKIAVTFGEGLLSSVRVVMDALVDALASLANTMMDLLDTKIYIPANSDILEAIGIPSISYFDAPFPDNSNVNAIKPSSSWADLVALFGKTADYKAPSKINARSIPHELEKVVHIAGHAATGWHFYELSQKPASAKQAAEVLGEVANLTSSASRISYAVAVNIGDPVTKQIAIIAMLAGNVASGGLHTAEAFLVE
ncbi:hypothetical protein F4824DRAFT_517862 [Ustulina deusta]|nr:hypothetical protein F4824DRAFT_517862 [Ustulina deusta]